MQDSIASFITSGEPGQHNHLVFLPLCVHLAYLKSTCFISLCKSTFAPIIYMPRHNGNFKFWYEKLVDDNYIHCMMNYRDGRDEGRKGIFIWQSIHIFHTQSFAVAGRWRPSLRPPSFRYRDGHMAVSRRSLPHNHTKLNYRYRTRINIARHKVAWILLPSLVCPCVGSKIKYFP